MSFDRAPLSSLPELNSPSVGDTYFITKSNSVEQLLAVDKAARLMNIKGDQGPTGPRGPSGPGSEVFRVQNSTNIISCLSNTNGGGDYNFFVGQYAGISNTSGSCNVFIGASAGECNTNGSNNLFLGQAAGADSIATITTESNRIIIGNALHTCAQIQTPWSVVSDCRDKCIIGNVPHGRGFLQNITPVEYAFKDRTTGCITDPKGKRRYGFSAQEILAVEGENPVIVSSDDPEKLQLTSDYLIPVLVNAIKELSEKVDKLEQIVNRAGLE